MSKYVWGIAILVAVGGLIAVGSFSDKFGGGDPQDSSPASSTEGSSSLSDEGLDTQTVSFKVPGMT